MAEIGGRPPVALPPAAEDRAPAPSRADKAVPARHGAAGAIDAVTVGEVQRVVLAGSRVAGGRAGLGRRVAWAASLRSRPPAFEPRGGGEFVLASAEALGSLRQIDPSLSVARILEGLAGAGVVAFALPGPAPKEAIAAADRLGLPLIELRVDAPLVELERGIISLVLSRHNELQARASALYHRLARLSVEARGLDAMLQEAATATGRIVAFEDEQYRLRAMAAPAGGVQPSLDGNVLSSVEERGRLQAAARMVALPAAGPPAIALTAARWGLERVVAPVVTRGRTRGFVSLCGEAQSLTEFDHLAASRLAEICAIELAKEDAVLATERRVQGDVVDELLRPYGDAEAAARRAQQAGLPLTGAYGVLVFAAEPRESTPGPAGAGSDQLDLQLAEAMGRRIRQAGVPLLMRPGAGELLIVCALPAPAQPDGPAAAPGGAGARSGAGSGAEGQEGSLLERRLRSLGAQVFAAVQEAAGELEVSGGVSRPCTSLTTLSQAAREAREALRIGRRVHGSGRLVAFSELGLYRVLYALRDSPELRTFCEQLLGPLVEYDRRYGQNLVETLEAFFECHGNLSQTAQRLGYHRNSLNYKIGRIQEIGGIDLEDPETRLALQVALKARRLLA